jgi:hypothetical protein
MKRKPRSRRSSAKEFSDSTKLQVFRRYGGKCGMCGGPPEEYHHRKMRSQGGTGEYANCLLVCHRCHRQIHDNPDWAYRHGLLVRSHNHPNTVKTWLNCQISCFEKHCDG